MLRLQKTLYCIKERRPQAFRKSHKKAYEKEGIKIVKRKKKRFSSYLGELSPAVPNIVNRNFSASAPNENG